MKGLIIVGYQGIGKSSCAGKNNCIDLESGNFWVNNMRDSNWYKPYCQIAMHLANQGYTVFTSSHEVVYKYFKNMELLPNVGKVVVMCPERIHKDLWIERLQKRYDSTQLVKDYKALMNAKERYDENIIELVNSGLPVYQFAYVDYDLMNYVHAARYDWCDDK